MNILFISRGYPSKTNPQWGCFEKDQANAIKELGHIVSIMSVERGLNTYKGKFGISRRVENEINIYNYRTLLPEFVLEKISYKLSDKYFEQKYLELFELLISEVGLPDVIYAHYLGNMQYLGKIKRIYNVPIVGMEHWSKINTNAISSSLYRKGLKAYSNVDKLIAVSRSLQDKIQFFWKKSSILINNMVGPEFSYVDKKNRKAFQFVSCGTLIKLKGFDLLIEAFSNSSLINSNCTIVIIGEGKERKNLEKLINDKGLKKQVKLIGKKSKNEIKDILSESNAFVLVSRSETFGVVYLEAMMTGLPVIGTRCGGPEEIINESNGILVDVNDVKGVQHALETMYDNISNYDGYEISNDCRRKYSPNVISAKIINVFEQAIAERKR